METSFPDKVVLESIRLLMAGAVDYAGLFPPSSVSMSEAVLNYATYRNSNYRWMLGRFVLGIGNLDIFFAFPKEQEQPVVTTIDDTDDFGWK